MSSKGKGKSKESKDHKSTSKSAAPTIPTDEEPENLGFLYTIDALEATYDEKHPPRILTIGGSKGNDIAHLWFPPNRAKMFKRQKGNMYRWRVGQSQLLDGYRRPEKSFEVASVFFQAQQDNFLAVFKDCTKCEIHEETHGWAQIGFHHSGYMSEVDIGGERDTLAAPANGSTWMPQVVPEVYNYDKNPEFPCPGESGGLCGKLSLLIAMAAFSAGVRNAENVVSTCFGLGIWRKHQFETGIGRYHNRGVVVTIYLDPDAEGVTTGHLKAFERGKYGPIFSPKQSQPSSYTHLPTTIPSTYGDPNAVPRGYSYQLPANPSGYAASGGYAVPPGYQFPSGYAPPSGHNAPSGYATTPMIQPSTNIYDEDDEDDEPEENKD